MGRKMHHNTVSMEMRDIVRAMIIDEKYQPGEKINIDNLVRDFGISKVPIREALKALENEELVVYKERAGWWVAAMSLEAFKETLEIQYVLEKHIAQHIISKLDYGDPHVSDVLKEMSQANRKFQRYSIAREYNHAMEQNYIFHSLYYSLYTNKSMGDYLKILWNKNLQFRREITMSPQLWNGFFLEHEGIINSIKEKNSDRLKELVNDHFMKSIESIDSIYDNYLKKTHQ